MSYQFVCPGCRNVLSLPANTPGAVFTCPHCTTQMQLPGVALPVAQPVLVAQTPPLNSVKTDDLAPGFLRGKAKETPGAGCVASTITTFVLAGVIVAIIFGIVHADRQNELASVPQEKPLPVAVANAAPGDPAPPPPCVDAPVDPGFRTGDVVEIVSSKGEGEVVDVPSEGNGIRDRLYIGNNIRAEVIDGVPRGTSDGKSAYRVALIEGIDRGKEVLAPIGSVRLKEHPPQPLIRPRPQRQAPTPQPTADFDPLPMLAFGYIIGAIILYFLPTVISMMRGHHNAGAIFVLNLFLGWTFIGWLIALIWSCTAVRSNEHHHYHHSGKSPGVN